ncbi:RHS repeat-associated core domain-containing protein [Clostridium sp.]|uniref:RHS repeat-associated core domain-containing protein n=1 Tax=Clostridium sp. TaxID=1506 RepID=UPI003D6D7A89
MCTGPLDGVTTKYYLLGSMVIHETNLTDIIYYTYGSSGSLVSMNLNGVEYYYIRNVQGDIIGLYDKTGTQVVGYIYDTWGKLISITGTLASSVGVKNPYRYRGYRYDTETGLYYLQSRYYNPSWGRFLNPDITVGSVGELTGANVFVYCKNNPTTLKDPSGFRPIYTAGVETSEMRKASLATMSKVNMYNYQHRSSNPSIKSKIVNVVKSVSATGSEGGASLILSKVPNAIPIAANRAARRLAERTGQSLPAIPIKGASALRGLGKIEKVGLVGVAFTGYSVWSNYNMYNDDEALGRSGIDVIVSTIVIGIGFITPVGWAAVGITMGAGLILTTVAEGFKYFIWENE